MNTNILDPEDQNLLQGMKFLDFETVQKGVSVKDPFEGVRTNRSFDEITYENKYGTIDKCKPFASDFYSGSIDAKELISDLRMNNAYNKFFFYYQKYLKESFNNSTGISPTVIAPVSSGSSYENNPFSYNDENGKVVYASLKIALNRRACFVNVSRPGFKFNIDNKKISFQISFTYQDALGQRIDDKSTKETNDFAIEDQFEGILITADNANDLLALSDQIGHRSFIETKLINLFLEKIKVANNGSDLKFLYENAPNFVLKQLLYHFKPEELWKHVELLTAYDDKGLFSGWVDGSSALLNVFKAFGNSYYIVSKFIKDPAFLKRIFKNLDGDTIIDNELISNKMAFASLIHACLMTNTENKDKKTIIAKTFYYGNGYSIDSNVSSWFNDEKDDEFFLKQRKTTTSTGTAINANDFSEEEYQSETTVDAEEGQMYHPLDMVTLVDYSSSTPITVQVPAIFIKALATDAEKQKIDRNIRIGFDILAIVIGVIITATTANPGALALALAEISLATGDIAVQDATKELAKTPEGREFLNNWEGVYMAGGFALAIINAPQLVESVFVGGTKLLRFAKTATSANFLKTCLLKALLEIEIANFTKNTVKLFENEPELILATKGVLDNIKLDKLYLQSALVVKGSVQTTKGVEEQVAIIYKGEAIAVANKWNFAKATKDIIKNINDEKKLVEVCEALKNIAILSNDERFLETLAKVLKEKMHPFLKYISLEEEAVIRYYTTSAYEELNKFLRKLLVTKNEKTIKRLIAFRDALKSSLEKLPNSSRKMFYRSFYMEESKLRQLFKEGEIYTEDAFMSAAFDYDDFLNNWLQHNPFHNVIVKIEGKTAKEIRDISELPEEAEAMFNCGKDFDVVKMKKVPNPINNSKEVFEVTLKEK